ncbi:MAG: four helix bundle protein [Opitutia bacterium]|jgi:four helix bundle protein
MRNMMADAGWMTEEGQEASGYQRLEVWRLARELSVKVHRMTLEELPRFEMHEVGSQVRRSAKSIRANIVEGFGKRRYKLEFLRHLTYALGSAQETLDHLDTLHETGSLASSDRHCELQATTQLLVAKLTTFIRGVELNHRS